MMKKARIKRALTVRPYGFLACLVIACVVLTLVWIVKAAATLPLTQNFNGIGTSATATLPADFRVDKNNSSVRTVGTFAAAGTATEQVDGSAVATNASQGIYNFGSGLTDTGADRAIGFLSSASGTNSGNLYVELVNSAAVSLSGLRISYDVEKYRNGSNAAGFRIQMYYSTDGSTWTSAGANFLTSFPADANNNGFTNAPGSTVSISNQTLAQTIPAGSNFYLAWNYSVTSGTTVSNAQALAIDNISIQSLCSTVAFTVNNSGDGSDITPGNGICETGTGNGVCTLRAAIQESNALGNCEGKTIGFDSGLSGSTITLGSEIPITGAVTINGLGANLLTIDGGAGTNRIFHISATTTISGLTLQGGDGRGATPDFQGGAIMSNGGSLWLDKVAIQNNFGSNGGGVVFNASGSHRITNSTISGNSSFNCGGIRAAGGTV
ncbi:MAG TPA: hypothetical protein VJU84_08060, partial [Pyrinomonadaceae bacterium]|nr:hypothetical protein [Pyrinomonadaceae bacterium]